MLKMRRCNAEASIVPKLKAMRVELNSVMSPSKLGPIENGGLAVATFVFILMEMVEKVEELAKEVEELGELANFCYVPPPLAAVIDVACMTTEESEELVVIQEEGPSGG